MPKRGRTGTRWLLAPVLATALLVPGCGPDPITRPKSTRTIITQREWALDALDALAVDITITGLGSGTLDATAQWTFATDDVDIYVTATACTPTMFASQLCSYKIKADSQTAKPENVAFGVSAGDTYRFWIVNFGPQRESGTFEAGVTQ